MDTNSHKDVAFVVSAAGGSERVFTTWGEAAGFALVIAASYGKAKLDVLVHSKAGALWFGGGDAAKQYMEDPEASVFERLEIKASSIGRVP